MSHLLPMGAAAASGVLVGLAIVATRFAIDQTGPASLAVMRYLIGVVLLLPLFLASRRVRFRRGDLLPVMLLGTGQFGILILLMNWGLQYIPSGRAALIFATMPFLTMIISVLAGRENLSLGKAAGVVLTIAGVGLALWDKAAITTGGPTWPGDLAVFGSALAGAVCSVLYRPYLRRYPTLQVGTLAMFAAVLFLILPAGAEGFFGALPRLNGPGWAAVVFLGLASAAGYYFWLWALNHTTPTRVTIFLGLNPITATLVGGAVLGERLTVPLFVGLVVFCLGLWVAHRPEPED